MKVKVAVAKTDSWAITNLKQGYYEHTFNVSDDIPMPDIFKKVASILLKLAKKTGTPYPIFIEIIFDSNSSTVENKLREYISKINLPNFVMASDYYNNSSIGIVSKCNEVSVFDLASKFMK